MIVYAVVDGFVMAESTPKERLDAVLRNFQSMEKTRKVIMRKITVS